MRTLRVLMRENPPAFSSAAGFLMHTIPIPVHFPAGIRMICTGRFDAPGGDSSKLGCTELW